MQTIFDKKSFIIISVQVQMDPPYGLENWQETRKIDQLHV